MSSLFSPDNLVWRIMARIADLFVLTLIWLLCSLPLITIGAATTALYHVTLQIAEKRDGYLVRTYFQAFRNNLKSSTGLWLLLAGTGIIECWGIGHHFYSESSPGKLMIWFYLVFGMLYLFFVTAVFPLSARLDTGLKNLCLMTVMVCAQRFSWVLLMTVTTGCILAICLFVFWPVFWFSAGTIALIHSYILVHEVFPKYRWNIEN